MAPLVPLLLAALAGQAETPERADAIRAARELLQRELGVEPRELTVVDAAAVDWRDSSLGCPEKGRRYLQALVPGHRVVLEHAGQELVVHVGAGRAVRCERGFTAPLSEKQKAAAAVARLLAEARRDLARRLGVPEGEVKPGALRRVTWPDAGLGCPRPGEVYAQVQTEGYVIELEAAGARHVYHSDRERVLHCPQEPER